MTAIIDIGGQRVHVKTWQISCERLRVGDSIVVGPVDAGKLLTIDSADDELTPYGQRVFRDGNGVPVYIHADTMVPATELQRRFEIPCMFCKADTPVEVELVRDGLPQKTVCGPCAGKTDESGNGRQLVITMG